MNKYTYCYCVLLSAIFESSLSVPTLAPSGVVKVSENSSLTFGCIYAGLVQTGDFFLINWFKNGRPNGFVSNICVIDEDKLSSNYYNVSCPDLNQQNITINRVGRTSHGDVWLCEVFVQSTTLRSENTTIIVRVPVTSVTLTQPTEKQIDATEGTPATFVCQTSPCRPEATITWYKSSTNGVEQSITGNISTSTTGSNYNLTITTNTLYYSPARSDQNYTIYCKANNNGSQTVTSKHKPQLNVRYAPDGPPVIEGVTGSTYTLVENTTLNLLCVVTGGNLRPTLTWSCNGGLVTDESSGTETKSRIIWTAVRHRDGPCRCNSSHPVVSTNQSTEVNVEILYTTILSFTIDGYPGETMVNENHTNILFSCAAGGSTPSNMYLQTRTYNGESRLVDLKSRNSITYSLQVATCYDTGVYSCYAQIRHTTTLEALRSNYLSVKCSPRPRYTVDQLITVYKALGNPVTLNLTLIAYPEPSPEQIHWTRGNETESTEVTNSQNIYINNIGLNPRLTIFSLMESDFGTYNLVIQYDTMEYTHNFIIKSLEKPQMPLNIAYIEDRLSFTTATFTWEPGFDGGLPQTFIILYKLKSATAWNSEKTLLNSITLNGLAPGSIYNVKMFANNDVGKSSETTTLSITTQSASCSESSSTSLSIAGTLGWVVAAVIIVVVVVVSAVLLWRRRQAAYAGQEGKCRQTEQHQKDHKDYNTDIYMTDRGDVYYNTERGTYEDIQEVAKNTHEYGRLDSSNDTDSGQPNMTMYQNLDIDTIN